MHRFKSIAVQVISEEGYQDALGRAVQVARRSGASLSLVSVVEDFPWYTRLLVPDSGSLSELLSDRRRQALEALAGPIGAEGITVTIRVRRGRPYLETVREVLRAGHDLVVKDAEPDRGTLFGSNDLELSRYCPCPVWLVKPAQRGKPFERVLAAVDPRPAPRPDEVDPLHLHTSWHAPDPGLDPKILDLATSLANIEGAELHVLHAWNAPGEDLLRGDPRVPSATLDDYVERMRTESQTALEGLLAGYPAEPGKRFVHLRKGNPADVIADFVVEQKIDLLVMGSVVRTGVPGFLVGNTAETVFDRVPCSVLTVKPQGFVSPVTLGKDEG